MASTTSSAGGALADFAKKPLGYKVAVFAAVGAVIGLLYWQFVLSPLRSERNELEMTRQSLEDESHRLDRDLGEYKKLSARSEELKKAIEENQKALPTGAELPAFFDTLNRKVGEAGVEVKKWEYKKEVPIETFIKVPLEIEITGTFYQIKRFFASLVQKADLAPVPGEATERERIITIENLVLTVPKTKGSELLLSAKFTASTFRQEQAQPAEAPAKAGAKPKAGAGAAPAAAGGR